MDKFNISSEEFKNIAQGIQAISISIAAIAGGIWGMLKLYMSKELDKSKIEALQKKKEYESKKRYCYSEIETIAV